MKSLVAMRFQRLLSALVLPVVIFGYTACVQAVYALEYRSPSPIHSYFEGMRG
jgi:hypothetical protein